MWDMALGAPGVLVPPLAGTMMVHLHLFLL